MGIPEDELEFYRRESARLLEEMGYKAEDFVSGGLMGNCQVKKEKFKKYCEASIKISKRLIEAANKVKGESDG